LDGVWNRTKHSEYLTIGCDEFHVGDKTRNCILDGTAAYWGTVINTCTIQSKKYYF
jgi:hypothetical protein